MEEEGNIHIAKEGQKEGAENRGRGKCLNRTNTATVLKPRGKDLYFAFGSSNFLEEKM